MPLEVMLKPGDCIYIGMAKVVVRSDQYTKLSIEGTLPVLREDDFIELGDNPSKARQLYVMLQDAYLKNNLSSRQAEYIAHVTALLQDDPAAEPIAGRANRWLSQGNVFKALKVFGSLVGPDS